MMPYDRTKPIAVNEEYFAARDLNQDQRIAALEAAVPPVSISGIPPTTGKVGQAYSFTPTVTGGIGTKTFTLSSGVLLGGLTFNNATGAITGTPTVAGTMSGLVITVTDSRGSASTTATSVTIAAAVVPVSISGTPPTTGQVGQAYSFTPTTANGSGSKSFTLSSGTLLGGLSFNTATGAITGSPTVAGTMTGLIVTVTDSTGSASTTATSVTIAASAQPVVISPWAYADDLEDATAGSDLMIRPNWSAQGAATDRYRVGQYASGKAAYNGAGYRQQGDLLYGPDLNTDAGEMGWEIEIDENRQGNPGEAAGSTFEADRQRFLLFYRDASNYLTLTNGADGISPRVMNVANAGTETFIGNSIKHMLQVAPPTAPAGTASNKFTLQYHKGRLRYRFGFGEWALRADVAGYPYDSPDITKYPGLTDFSARHGRVGIRNATWTYPLLNGVRIKPLKMVITSHARYCSRTTFTSGVGRIWIKGDYVGTMVRTAYRVWSMPAPKTLVQDTKDITDAVFDSATGTFSLNALIPQGGPYEIELIMTDSEGKTYNTWTKRVACGEFYITNGQSNSANRGYPISAGLTTFSQKVASQKYVGNNPDNVPDYELTGLGTNEFTASSNSEMARTISDATGVPCLVYSTGIPGSGIGGIIDDTNFAKTFVKTCALIDGVVDGVVWDQGEGDRDGAFSPDTYATQLETILNKMATASGNPNLPMWIAPIGRFASASSPSGASTWVNVDKFARVIKLAYEALMAKYPTRVRYSSHKLGLFHGTNGGGNDAYHYTSAAYEEESRRDGRSIAKDRGFNVPDGRGPTPTALARAGAVLTLAVNRNGAATLTDLVTKSTAPDDAKGVPALSGALYGYEVSADDFASLLTISSIAANSDHTALVITLAADPGKAVKIRSYHGASYDDRQMFWGTGYAGGREDVPIAPILNYLTSN